MITKIVDPSGSAIATTTLINNHSRGPSGTLSFVFEGSKNIGSLKTGPGDYVLHFSFPGEAGGTMVSAVGLSGIAPGLAVNGLVVRLKPDLAVVASLQGALRPYFKGGSSVLDASGNATGYLRVGRDRLGIVVHVAAATFDNGGVKTVSAPYPMRL